MNKQIKDLTHDNMPASAGLVKAVRDELRADIRSVDHKIESVRNDVMASIHRVEVLVEEQRSENRIVLDGIKTMIERQDRVETDVEKLKETVKLLGTTA